MNLVIYDTEIRHGVLTPDNPPQDGYRYAKGWHDYTGMGIATICAYDIVESRYRVFLEDNFTDFFDLIAQRDGVLGFNNWRFDDKLLRENGFTLPREKSHDLADAIWRAAGIPQGEHPRGLSLNACCNVHGLPTKSGNGADAPQDFQDGRIGRVIDYCLNDVRCTLHLYRYIERAGGLIDARDGTSWLNVRVAK